MIYYRPDQHDDDWEDNPLSNSMAYLSKRFTKKWCISEKHWTVKLVLYLWTDCACCLFFRGVTLGLLVGLVLGVAVTLMFN